MAKTDVFPSINQVTKHAYLPRTQYIDKIVGMPAVIQRMVPRIQTSWKTVEVPAGVVRRQSCGGACDHADALVVPAPVPQILEEPIVPQFQVEIAEEAQLFPHERISELTVEVDDVHPASATVLGKRKKKKKKGVVDAPQRFSMTKTLK